MRRRTYARVGSRARRTRGSPAPSRASPMARTAGRWARRGTENCPGAPPCRPCQSLPPVVATVVQCGRRRPGRGARPGRDTSMASRPSAEARGPVPDHVVERVRPGGEPAAAADLVEVGDGEVRGADVPVAVGEVVGEGALHVRLDAGLDQRLGEVVPGEGLLAGARLGGRRGDAVGQPHGRQGLVVAVGPPPGPPRRNSWNSAGISPAKYTRTWISRSWWRAETSAAWTRWRVLWPTRWGPAGRAGGRSWSVMANTSSPRGRGLHQLDGADSRRSGGCGCGGRGGPLAQPNRPRSVHVSAPPSGPDRAPRWSGVGVEHRPRSASSRARLDRSRTMSACSSAARRSPSAGSSRPRGGLRRR